MNVSGSACDVTNITPLEGSALKPGIKWMPIQREEGTGVVARSRLLGVDRDNLIQSAAEILGCGVNPKDCQGSATGLVVGYVQSGKTLSFTTVIGLARDNGFPLIIVIAGNKDSLLTQSHNRLAKDLNVDGGDGLPAWKMRKNVRGADPHDEQFISQAISSWRDKSLDDDERATVLLTVLKQNQRLQSLTTLLRKLDLSDVPVLVIDDEADQASLNTKIRQGQESTTYTRLRDLRNALPCHTYLQYTATPQAPLLINIADVLSPNFVRVLEPGADYVGGADFFSLQSAFIHDIPADDLLPSPDPPESMLEAGRIFFVGLAASLILSKTRRSMLVHPSRMRADHRQVVEWITAAKDVWHQTLMLDANDPDRQQLLIDFYVAYQDLMSTCVDLPSFDDILAKLPRALRNTTVIEFNTNGRPKTPDISWRDAEGWILVGGQAVDRGFTVDLLTVTYMQRGVGMGNADALQQRARFFGYKRNYIGLCRIYLEPNTRQAFENYIEHEELMRGELQRLADTGESLRTWRRRFVLSADLQPCRRSVISDDYLRARPGGGWTQQRGAEMTGEMRRANAEILGKFNSEFKFELEDTTYPTTEVTQQHLVCENVPLQRIIDMLLDFRFEDPRDTAAFTGILVALGAAAQDSTARVYLMRPHAGGLKRTVSDIGTLENGFQQGMTSLAGGVTAYPGDAAFRASNRLTLQFHRYDLTKTRNGPVIAAAAPLLAVHIPSRLAKEWLVQVQGGQGNS